MKIDLHTHTNCSDGTLSPRDLVDLAKASGVSVLAVTDHDTINGCAPAVLQGEKIGVKVISGVELSIAYPLPKTGHLHLLGLFIDPQNETLNTALTKLSLAREQRGEEILQKLAKINMPINSEELKAIVNGGSTGRPHIVSLLLKKGYIRSAFQGYTQLLGKGGAAYVSKEKLNLETALSLIHRAGGIAILAHPISLMFANYPRLGEEILKFKEMGLDGVEVFYSSHDHYFTKWLYDFCLKQNLQMSGGSDFHGSVKPDIVLGRGRGNLRIPYQVFKNLGKFHLKKTST